MSVFGCDGSCGTNEKFLIAFSVFFAISFADGIVVLVSSKPLIISAP
jgi:hypothetical protein